MKNLFRLGFALAGLGILAGCQYSKPNFTFMPDMAWQPSFKAQEEGSMRTPPPGTIPRDFTPYAYPNDPEGAGKNLRNPYPMTKGVLTRGKELYNIYCIVCHGEYGEGNGSVVPKFPAPPTLQSDKVKNYPDGRIFHIISIGQNLMPSYASQILADERWKVVNYVRVLQRARNPRPEDLKVLEAQ